MNSTDYRRYEGSQTEQVVAGTYYGYGDSRNTYRIVALRDYRERAAGKPWTLREAVTPEALASFDALPGLVRCG